MATITISLSGSAIAGLSGGATKTYTVSDADLQSLLNWATQAYASVLPASPTAGQVLLAWVQAWVTGTKGAVQQFMTAVPAQINMA